MGRVVTRVVPRKKVTESKITHLRWRKFRVMNNDEFSPQPIAEKSINGKRYHHEREVTDKAA